MAVGVAFLSLSCISVRRHHQHMKALNIVRSTIPTRNFFDLGSIFITHPITRRRQTPPPNARLRHGAPVAFGMELRQNRAVA